jgi:outer membrane protein TolC
MKKIIALTIIICLAIFHARAQDTLLLPLDTLLQRVETNYPAILQYPQNILAWEAKAEGANAWMPPTFSAGAMRFPYDFSLIDNKDDPMNQAGIIFSLEQMFPNSGKINARRDYLHSLADVETARSNWTKNELRRQAKLLYYQRYISQQKQKTVSESEEVLNLVLSTAEARFSSNQSQLQTIYKAKARLAELKNMQYMLQGIIAESNIGINILMVRDVNTPFEIDSLISLRQYPLPLPDTSLISNRSDIAAVSKYIHSMALEQKVMNVGTRPEFGVRAEHMQMFGMPNQWSVMGMMTIPIVPWSSKMYTSEAKSIGYQIQSMELEKQNMQLMATKMLTEKRIMLTYEYGQYENYRLQIIPAYEDNLQANLLAYRQNTGDLFVLLDAWEMLLMKKLEMYDRLQNILTLEAEYEYEMEIK